MNKENLDDREIGMVATMVKGRAWELLEKEITQIKEEINREATKIATSTEQTQDPTPLINQAYGVERIIDYMNVLKENFSRSDR